jgi:Ca2+-binding RTX toxin-like protein
LVPRSLPWLTLALAVLCLASAASAATADSERTATASAGRSCLGMKATIVSASATIAGTKAPDAIVVKGAGEHRVNGLGGNDRICGGPGNDRLNGGRGNDALEGGGGDDALLGDKGNDRAGGGAGNDAIEGGAGDDDPLDGGPGTDSVIGGTGTDAADGGDGDDDVVRGDAGPDSLSGGPGVRDIVSYASATRRGVTVDLTTGKGKGDGHDSLDGFEDAVGSPQGDTLVGVPGGRLDGGVGDDALMGAGGGEAFGGPGTDSCNGFAVQHSCGPEAAPPAGAAYVVLDQGLAGSNLIVQGGPGADQLRISSVTGTWIVADSGRVVAGEGCAAGAAGQVVCPEGGGASLVVATGGGGDDTVAIDPSVSAAVSVRINGNAGNDTLQGGPGDDVLEAGENYKARDSGHDTLEGNGGSDVLYADPGADALRGGPGNDLLTSSVLTCQSHSFDGGVGKDTVSYARSDAGVRATIGAGGGPPGCGTPDRIAAANESLEGSDGPDVLMGTNGRNSLLGHLGADTLIGKGGNDFLDSIDGLRDRRIDCGVGADEASNERGDPRPLSCERLAVR